MQIPSRSGWGLRLCSCNKLPGDADAAGSTDRTLGGKYSSRVFASPRIEGSHPALHPWSSQREREERGNGEQASAFLKPHIFILKISNLNM